MYPNINLHGERNPRTNGDVVLGADRRVLGLYEIPRYKAAGGHGFGAENPVGSRAPIIRVVNGRSLSLRRHVKDGNLRPSRMCGD